MNPTRLLAPLALVAHLFASAPASGQPTPATNAFTFQGRLLESDRPNTAQLQASFQLYASATGLLDIVSPQIVRTLNFDQQGRFTVSLDFGETFNGFPVFNGDERYLQIILLDPPGGIEEDFPLSPRTPLTAAPLAAYALNARIPTLAEITDDRLESTDADGSLAINVYDDDLGLTIRPAGGTGAKYSYSGVSAADAFTLSTAAGDLDLIAAAGDASLTSIQKDIRLNAGLGDIGLLSGGLFSVTAANGASITLGTAGLTADALNVDLDADAQVKLRAPTLDLSATGLLKLTGALTQITGPLVIQNHQINADLVNLSGVLTVSNNGLKPGGGPWGGLSDRRFKRNIAGLSGSLDTLNQLRPVRFEYKPGHPLAAAGEFRGFIAQEVLPILPEWISTDQNGALILTPVGFEALIVDAVQELEARNRAELDELRARNAELTARIDQLEALVRTLGKD